MPALTQATADKAVLRNVRIHDRIARKYERLHGEIFNDREQQRLSAALRRARDLASTGNQPLRALDFGCGSGNLTRHLLQLGLEVTAADVSQGFLDLVASRYPRARTLLMKNGDLSAVPDGSFDLIATYSVLHHIPDYLAACEQLARICSKGGVVMIDHERSENFWKQDPAYAAFQAQALRFDWRKYLVPANYVHRVRRMFDPRHSNEGDIHVWPDDHIEWPRILERMVGLGFEVVLDETYLANQKLYRQDVYERHLGLCSDTQLMVFRKRS